MVYITIEFNNGIECTSGWTPPPYWTSYTTYSEYDVGWAGVKPNTANGHNYLLHWINGSSGTTGGDDPFKSTDKNHDLISDGDVVWECFDEFTNPTIITGQPFGHGFKGSLWYLVGCCNDNYIESYIIPEFLSGSTYNVDSFSSQTEVAAMSYLIHNEGDMIGGHEYKVNEIWKKNGETIFFWEYTFNWLSSTPTWRSDGGFIGWTPCWWWKYGSKYDGYEEITDEGSDYSITIELYDNYTLLTSTTEPFSVINLHHTEAYWNHIQDHTGNEINGLFGMEASSYVHDLGDDTYITAYYKQNNLERIDSMYIDGMGVYEPSVELRIYRSGYVRQPCTRTDIVDGESNGPFNFVDWNYLRASVEGIVKDEDNNPVENVNVWGIRTGAQYGCKTASDGKYALPLHTAGTYTIKAIKNNHNIEIQDSDITQSTKHPDWATEKMFTESHCIKRITAYPIGTYAHLNTLAVDNQSVIIPDDPVTSDGSLPLPENVAGTIVKAKTVTWGSAPTQSTTSTGTWDSSTGYGSGGFDYDGDMGDAEEWEEE